MGMGNRHCGELQVPPSARGRHQQSGRWMWESQDAANYKLPALLTQTVVILIAKDLDLCLKSQTDFLKTREPKGGIIPLSG